MMDYCDTSDLSLWACGEGEPVYWTDCGIKEVVWNGHWELEVWGPLFTAGFLFDILHVPRLDVMKGSFTTHPVYFPSDVVLRFHDLVVREKHSDDLVSPISAMATLYVRFEVWQLEVMRNEASQKKAGDES